MKKEVYFAGPLFSDAERAFNLALTKKIESLGYNVFLPQRDGAESIKNFFKLPRKERNKKIFEIDRDHDLSSDVFLFILDGRVPDEGAGEELGMAYAQKYFGIKPNKKIIGFKTDWRGSFPKEELNQMIGEPLDFLFKKEEDLLKFLKKEIKKIVM